ncbi:MAG: putative ABC transporter permease [Firmicutes bacterium]|nr:putative ABC transporter permease [Bacillota bacterium]
MVYFTLYSVFGWAYEVFLEVVIYKWGYADRGVLFGPYCPVYGFGALLFIIIIYPMINRKAYKDRLKYIPLVFLLSMLIATALELGTSYLLEMIIGYWPWQTYADYKINYQARIALSPSVRFGIGGVLFLYILQPLFEKLTGAMSDKTLKKTGLILFIIFAVDLAATVVTKLLLK